jgi:hypothetical protein
LPRKLRFTVLALASSHPVAYHSNSQFSRQPLVAFEPGFDFQDRLRTLDRLQRPKTFRGVNPRPRFPRQVASCHAVNFLGDFRLSQQKRILFEICFVILDRFDTSKHSIESKIICRAIWFCQIWISMKSESMGGIFVRKLFDVGEYFSAANSTLISYFSMLNKIGLIGSSWILTGDENFIEIDLVVLNLHRKLDNITTNFKKCQFATAHIASRAGNMYCEWIGSCYVHKSLPLELSGLRCVFDKPGNIYLPMRHIFKLAEHFGSVG